MVAAVVSVADVGMAHPVAEGWFHRRPVEQWRPHALYREGVERVAAGDDVKDAGALRRHRTRPLTRIPPLGRLIDLARTFLSEAGAQ